MQLLSPDSGTTSTSLTVIRPAPSESQPRVSFTASLDMDRQTFMAAEDGYLTAVAAAAEVSKDSVSVSSPFSSYLPGIS
eukprot:2326177-Rhodomonas_salina.1